MPSTLQRKYSRAKAVGNHVVWTEKEILNLPFTLDGLVFDQAEFGYFRVIGRDVLCAGFQADFAVPAGSRSVSTLIEIVTGAGDIVAGTDLTLHGTVLVGEKRLAPPLVMPVNSTWKIRVTVMGEDEERYFPQSLTVIYRLRYTNGPASLNAFVSTFNQFGVGVEQIGQSRPVTVIDDN